MTDATDPITEEDLHAFVDGQLDDGRRQAVMRYLDETPSEAMRVRAWQDQRTLLRQAFAAEDATLLPGDRGLAHILAHRQPTPVPRAWLFAASVLLALGVGAAGGWLAHPRLSPAPTPDALAFLEQEAVTSHVVYAVDKRHPVEVTDAETPHLQQWLSNRLERTIVAPDLSSLGFHLIGGRLLATEHGGAAALLMYDNASHQRISLLLRPMASMLRSPGDPIQQRGVNGRAWIGNGLGVAVVAAIPDGDIARLATQIDVDLGTHG